MALTEGVAFLDFRADMTPADYENDFFKTDHHWNLEGAFRAFCKLTAVLPDYGFSVDPAWTDWDSYEKTVYEDSFLGSQGKRVGTLFAGLDDLTAIDPEFDTDFVFSCPSWGISRAGTMGESILFPSGSRKRIIMPAIVYPIRRRGLPGHLCYEQPEPGRRQDLSPARQLRVRHDAVSELVLPRACHRGYPLLIRIDPRTRARGAAGPRALPLLHVQLSQRRIPAASGGRRVKKQFGRAYVEITNQCNLRCAFCPGTRRAPRALTAPEFSHIIGELRPYTDWLCLHVMGEPLGHPDLAALLAAARDFGWPSRRTARFSPRAGTCSWCL
jgi:hypothetical protein